MTDRIKKVGRYFTSFNIAEGTIYALVTFPTRWTVVPTLDVDGAEVKIVKDNKSNGYYFFTDLANGADCVFDAIDEVIKFNQSIEEKTTLLKVKAQELKELFETEDIEKLRTLRFVFGTPVNCMPEPPKKENKKEPCKKKGKGKKDKSPKGAPAEINREEVTAEPKEEEKANEGSFELTQIKEEPTPIETKNVEGDSLLDVANDLV